jgi:hypothetical protein
MSDEIVHGDDRWGPWFRWHPGLVVAVAVTLYTCILVVGLAADASTEVPSLLVTLPIALVALAFGRRAGVGAAILGVVVVALTATTHGSSVDVEHWGMRALPMLLLGGLLGAASDRLRDGAELEQRLALAHRREREAAEINDSIIQQLAVAKWSLEAGNDQRSLELLTDTIHTAQALVADLLREHDDTTTAQGPSSPQDATQRD